MKRTTILMVMLTMLCLSTQAQYVPEGATQLYYSKNKGGGYGNNVSVLTIYEQSGKYYLRRLKGFSGAASPVMTKKDKIYRLPDATMELSKKQLNMISQLLAGSQLDALGRACMEEEQNNIATGYTKVPKEGRVYAIPWDQGSWEQVIEWPGVMTGVKTKGDVPANDYSNSHHQQRNIYFKAVAAINSELDEIIEKYVKKNINRLWREFENQ